MTFVSTEEHDAVVRQSFERQSGLFSGETALFAQRPASPTSWLGPLEPDMIVLDVACGAAHVAEQAAPAVRQVVGVDLTPALLRLGADRLRDAGIGNVLLQEGNAAELPFVDASFDLVVCRAALHHFPRPAEPVAEMARVCRPGGRVAISDMVAPSLDARKAFDELHCRLDPCHAGALVHDELAELLRSTIGPLTHLEAGAPLVLPIDHVLTDVADRDAVMSALRAEISGGPPTGFLPVLDGDQVVVSFANTVAHASPVSST
jgi:ubiquinone/menaquinone biosynthesis C-methylase UbiE